MNVYGASRNVRDDAIVKVRFEIDGAFFCLEDCELLISYSFRSEKKKRSSYGCKMKDKGTVVAI